MSEFGSGYDSYNEAITLQTKQYNPGPAHLINTIQQQKPIISTMISDGI